MISLGEIIRCFSN